ncbi:hypothetical protein MCUN1_000650 [Malassezia cuniculi]|uniref:type II protein arginine methyltransferase n=1 Tax=Malassezia cuniculi TaxID=948313 RepID=A0AAF0ERJ6_9BASI|nr:hypothetical protein MCUN1_000650 [Malassezia cuniculi]
MHRTCLTLLRVPLVRAASIPPPARTFATQVLCTEHRSQFNYDVFAEKPEEHHYSYPMVTANDLAQNKTRPRSVRMLSRDFIHDSLYNPYYGYFSRQAVLLPESGDSGMRGGFPFREIRNDAEFMRIVQERYQDFEDRYQQALAERRKNDPIQARIEQLGRKAREARWGSAEALDVARERGRLLEQQDRESVSSTEVDTMVAGQVWHTPTQLFRPHYARAVARYLVAEYKLHLFPFHDLTIFELGGGAGTLARDILDYIEHVEPDVYARMRYRIVEISARLARDQSELLSHHRARGAVEVVNRDFLQWDEDVQEPCFVVALEVLDNLAHDVVRYSTGDFTAYEGIVSVDSTGDFTELWEPVQDPLIRRYLELLNDVQPRVLPPGVPTYLGWLPRSVREVLHNNMPLYPNLSKPHFIPTGALRFVDVLHRHFPLHRLVLSDFNALPDAVEGVNGPVVQTRHNGKMIPVTTYCVLQGYFDIFFPTDFELLRAIYLRAMSLPADVNLHENRDSNESLGIPTHYFSSQHLDDPRYGYRDGYQDAARWLYEDYTLSPSHFPPSDVIPPPLLSTQPDARIMTHGAFLQRYAETDQTTLADGSNPMVSWYANASWLLT